MPKLPAVLLSLLVSASNAYAADAAGVRSDSEITARVRTALIRDDEAKARQIDVQTQNGIVQLSGFVDSERTKKAAEKAAMDVAGVRQLRNELIVREDRTAQRGQDTRPTGGDRSTGRVTDDAVIAAQVKSQLAGESGLATASDVDVNVRNGVVQLSGLVSSAQAKREAESIARNVDGVTEVHNDIEVDLSH